MKVFAVLVLVWLVGSAIAQTYFVVKKFHSTTDPAQRAASMLMGLAWPYHLFRRVTRSRAGDVTPVDPNPQLPSAAHRPAPRTLPRPSSRPTSRPTSRPPSRPAQARPGAAPPESPRS